MKKYNTTQEMRDEAKNNVDSLIAFMCAELEMDKNQATQYVKNGCKQDLSKMTQKWNGMRQLSFDDANLQFMVNLQLAYYQNEYAQTL